jgi:hypothetical protein
MNGGQLPPAVMPGFMPGIHVFAEPVQAVDGRDKPDHDAGTGFRHRPLRHREEHRRRSDPDCGWVK